MSSTATNEFSLRVDGDNSAALAAWLAPLGSYVICREAPRDENVHMHVLLITNKNIKQVRNSFTRAFPGATGNGGYSLTAVEDGSKYRRYVCKGADPDTAPEIVGRQGVEFTDEWVASQHESYWEVNKQLQEAREKRKRPVFEVVYQECVTEHVLWHDDKTIAKKYIKHMSEANKGINLFQIRSSVNLLKIKLCPDDSALDSLAEIVANKN